MAAKRISAQKTLHQIAKDSNGVLEYGPMAEAVIVKAMRKYADQESEVWIKLADGWQNAYNELLRITNEK